MPKVCQQVNKCVICANVGGKNTTKKKSTKPANGLSVCDRQCVKCYGSWKCGSKRCHQHFGCSASGRASNYHNTMHSSYESSHQYHVHKCEKSEKCKQWGKWRVRKPPKYGYTKPTWRCPLNAAKWCPPSNKPKWRRQRIFKRGIECPARTGGSFAGATTGCKACIGDSINNRPNLVGCWCPGYFKWSASFSTASAELVHSAAIAVCTIYPAKSAATADCATNNHRYASRPSHWVQHLFNWAAIDVCFAAVVPHVTSSDFSSPASADCGSYAVYADCAASATVSCVITACTARADCSAYAAFADCTASATVCGIITAFYDCGSHSVHHADSAICPTNFGHHAANASCSAITCKLNAVHNAAQRISIGIFAPIHANVAVTADCGCLVPDCTAAADCAAALYSIAATARCCPMYAESLQWTWVAISAQEYAANTLFVPAAICLVPSTKENPRFAGFLGCT